MIEDEMESSFQSLSNLNNVGGFMQPGRPAPPPKPPQRGSVGGEDDDKHHQAPRASSSCSDASFVEGNQQRPTVATMGASTESEDDSDFLLSVVRERCRIETNFNSRIDTKTPAVSVSAVLGVGGIEHGRGEQDVGTNSSSEHFIPFPEDQKIPSRSTVAVSTEMGNGSEASRTALLDVVSEGCGREAQLKDKSEEKSSKLMGSTSSNTKDSNFKPADMEASNKLEANGSAGNGKKRGMAPTGVGAYRVSGPGRTQATRDQMMQARALVAANTEMSDDSESSLLDYLRERYSGKSDFNDEIVEQSSKTKASMDTNNAVVRSKPSELGPSRKLEATRETRLTFFEAQRVVAACKAHETATNQEAVGFMDFGVVSIQAGAPRALAAHETTMNQEDVGLMNVGAIATEAGTPRALAGEGVIMSHDQRGEECRSSATRTNGRSSSFDTSQTRLNSFSMEMLVSSQQKLLEAILVEEDSVGSVLTFEATKVEKVLCCTIQCPCLHTHRRAICGALVVLVVIAAFAIGLGLGFSDTPTAAVTMSTLERIHKNGFLRCGIGPPSSGIHILRENGERSGFDVALCRALAAAVLGEDATVEFIEATSYKLRFPPLANSEVDVVAAEVTHTMGRQIYEELSKVGFAFSSPYLYVGLHFAGVPEYVNCTENGIRNTGECANLRVCTMDGTTPRDMLSRLLPERQLYVVRSFEEMVAALSNDDCSVLAEEGYQLNEAHVRGLGYKGIYQIGTSIYSKEPLCLVSRSDDSEWSSFVNVVLHGLFLAEKYNITKATAHMLPQTDVFGESHKNLFRDSVTVEGNYGELYSENMEAVLQREQINSVNAGSMGSGLLWSHPMGAISNEGSPSIGYMDQIQQRGKIRCGIIPGRHGFAAASPDGAGYQGLEIELCGALSAALFAGHATEVDFVTLSSEIEGYAALHGGLVDVFAGATWNLQSYTYKSGTGSRVAFSRPYFYNNTGKDETQENLCLVTAADDHSWSSFVYWVLEGLIQAEEDGILMENGNDMPEVNVFGPNYYQMFRGSVLAVGNFGQMYNRSVEAYFPRSGRNLLNERPGPQIYLIPGLKFPH